MATALPSQAVLTPFTVRHPQRQLRTIGSIEHDNGPRIPKAWVVEARPLRRGVGPIHPSLVFWCCRHGGDRISWHSAASDNRSSQKQFNQGGVRPLGFCFRRQSEVFPLWVMNRHRVTSASCPLFRPKRTFIGAVYTSALCHKRTSNGSVPDFTLGAMKASPAAGRRRRCRSPDRKRSCLAPQERQVGP